MTETTQTTQLQKAYFAGGCFWCVEADFEKFRGIKKITSGYMGGKEHDPSYEQHGSHRETVELFYDPTIISYQDLVEYFFRHHDPTDAGGSFYDRGHAYTSAIYASTDDEEAIARQVIKDLGDKKVFPKPIVTVIERNATFWKAEEYHQAYSKKNPLHYKSYRIASGRENFINKLNKNDDKQ